MKNKNHTQSISDLTISSKNVFLMYFIAFGGIFCLTWIIYMLCGYPFWSFHDIDITAFNVARGLQTISVIFFIYIIYRQYIQGGLKIFAGMSLPITLLLTALFVREIFDCWYLRDHFVLRLPMLISFPLIVAAFSIPLNEKQINTAFYAIFIPFFILGIIMIITWSDWIFQGLTMRSSKWATGESQLIGSLCRYKADPVGGLNRAMLSQILLVGSSIGLMALTRLNNVKSILGITFMLSHTLGTILILVTGFRGYLVAYFIACFCIFLLYLIRRVWKTTGIILFILLIDCFLVLVIGYNDPHSALARLQTFFKKSTEFRVDVKKVVSLTIPEANIQEEPNLQKTLKESDFISEIEQQKGLKSNQSVLVEHPYILSQQPRDRKTRDYLKIANAVGISDARLAQYVIAVEAIRKKPILGYSSYLVADVGESPVRISIHCNVLTVFMAIGVIGGVLFLYVILRGCLDMIILFRYFPDFIWLGAIFLYAFISNLIATEVIRCIPLWIPLIAMRACVKTQIKPKLQEIKSEKIDEVKQ
jgi:hypothetical protein